MERAFINRTEAGRLLAEKLEKYADRNDVVVLGLPRGGVPVAYEVAKRLRAPLDVFIVRKLGVPGCPSAKLAGHRKTESRLVISAQGSLADLRRKRKKRAAFPFFHVASRA
jgi:predicted phosphoribosyltransferase